MNRTRAEETAVRGIVEALLFATDEPLSARRVAEIVDDVTPGFVEDLIEELNAGYLREGRAFRIASIAGGHQVVTRPEYAEWVKRLRTVGAPSRLTQAALETLSIVAYKQPVTRAELESIRGVSVEGVLRTLHNRELIRVAGRQEGIGRPLLYATTDHFLEYFGLPDLDALPKPEELEVLFADRERQAEMDFADSGEAGEEEPRDEE